MPEDIAARMSKDMSERMAEDMSARMSEDMLEEMSERYVRRYVRKNVKRYVRNNGERYVRKICQRICHQKECQKIRQKECQKMCQKDVRKNVRRYVRKNVRRYVRQNVRKYVPSICAYIDLDNKNSCLHQRNLVHGILFFVWFGTLQQVLLAQRFFCASKWVWFGSHGGGCGGTSWDDLHWDCQSVCQRSWACVALQADFCWCWAHLRVHGAALHYTCWRFDVYPGRSRGGKQVVCGVWREACSKCGGRARAGEARCSLSHFGLVLGEWSARVGDKWCAEQGHLHRRGERTAVASVGLHGLHTAWDVVAAPLPGLHLLDSTAFWRDGLMHVVCVCVCVWNYRRFASLDLTAFWRGGPMQWGRWHLTGAKLSWILLLLRGVR